MTKRGVFLLCLSALLLAGLTVNVNSGSERARPTVAQINGAINAQGACWVAKTNKFSTWTTDQLKRLLGVLPPETEMSDGMYSVEAIQAEEDYFALLQAKPAPSLPASFDWRASGGVTSVKDQGNCGSCWAFSSVGQLEALLKIKTGVTYDLSEQFLVSCETNNYGCDGGYMDRVYAYLKSTGTPDESCFKYQAADVACSNRCSNWAQLVKKIHSYTWVCKSSLNTTNIKNAIYTNGPLTVTMDVYNDFFSYSSGCYSHVTGAYAGGHAVLIVGWTSDNCWIVKNSWGPGWGEQGYFKIKFGNCRIGLNSAKFTL
jgi:C1A family cysteine protease